MTRKQRRLWTVGAGLVTVGLAVALVLNAFRDNLVYFYSPSDLTEREMPAGQNFRLGGLVAENSVLRLDDGPGAEFIVTDMAHRVPVHFEGLLPDLFREGQGVVVQGRLDESGVFIADQVLAKHDENYMPPEVADALKRSGYWQEGGEAGYAPGAPDVRALETPSVPQR